jgi:hypothetical protein
MSKARIMQLKAEYAAVAKVMHIRPWVPQEIQDGCQEAEERIVAELKSLGVDSPV